MRFENIWVSNGNQFHDYINIMGHARSHHNANCSLHVSEYIQMAWMCNQCKCAKIGMGMRSALKSEWAATHGFQVLG